MIINQKTDYELETIYEKKDDNGTVWIVQIKPKKKDSQQVMKDALIIFLTGLLTITMTLTVITEYKEHKKSNRPKNEFVCKNGGLPDYRCFPTSV